AAAPVVTLGATIDPATQETSITNIGVVEWALFDDPDDIGEASDDVTITIVAQAVVPPTTPPPPPPASLPPTGTSITTKAIQTATVSLTIGLAALVTTSRRRQPANKHTRGAHPSSALPEHSDLPAGRSLAQGRHNAHTRHANNAPTSTAQADEAGVAHEAFVGELGDLDRRRQLGAHPPRTAPV